ncbi:hypothetical protein G5V57_31400 [Nordella sp. HKS 07]|uniref:hypothetical protein n=1 Tax=Nordella sp. HKS 07 TaxID=2712222 RepID=UPI0013E1C744|nr:hypothetical protein [Nordella sp. HKS 07]QIG51819.1 hypothetical protein G5V57_31400 [Nordella sp. HKS 07]
MFYGYAVDPAAVSADWQTCRYLAEKLGFDRGRLRSLFRKAWLPLAIEAADNLPDMQKKRVIEMLKTLKDEASMRSGQSYDPALW